MNDTTLEDIERRLDRATELDREDAVSVLRTARDDVEALGNDPDVDEERRQAIEQRVDQRLREVSDRETYGGRLGAAMNPEEDDAP